MPNVPTRRVLPIDASGPVIYLSLAEEQTPITPLAISEFRARGPKGRGRISLSQDPALSLQYAGELIAAFIEDPSFASLPASCLQHFETSAPLLPWPDRLGAR